MSTHQNLIEKIKKKKELQGISDNYVSKLLSLYSSNIKNKRQEKDIIKKLRAELRIVAGQYIPKKLENQDFSEIIKSHKSTKERLPDYNLLKNLIFSLNPRSILDLGCGLNPLVIADKNIEYYACDIRRDIIDIVNSYFQKNKLRGKAFYCDITEIEKGTLPKVDLCLMLKLVDLIDRKDHKNTEELLKKIQAKHIILSFSTKTLSGRHMRHPQRGWIEQLSGRLGFKFNLIKTPTEIYYLLYR